MNMSLKKVFYPIQIDGAHVCLQPTYKRGCRHPFHHDHRTHFFCTVHSTAGGRGCEGSCGEGIQREGQREKRKGTKMGSSSSSLPPHSPSTSSLLPPVAAASPSPPFVAPFFYFRCKRGEWRNSPTQWNKNSMITCGLGVALWWKE